MDETPLYQRISAAIRQEILDGKLLPGDRLPPLREVTRRWNCTPGTVQRAYRDLANSGLALSRPGKGTFVAGGAPLERATPLRRASLVHRAETFLLEALTAGHSTDEIEQAVRMALDRWRVVQPNPVEAAPEHTIRFSGSHDPAVTWLAEHFSQVQLGSRLVPQFSGSLGGLIALAEGKVDVAGAHLWDESSDSYNAPFVRRLLPGQRVALVHLAYRRLGLILPSSTGSQVPARACGWTRLCARPGWIAPGLMGMTEKCSAIPKWRAPWRKAARIAVLVWRLPRWRISLTLFLLPEKSTIWWFRLISWDDRWSLH